MDEQRKRDDALFEALNRSKKKKRRKRLITVLIVIAVIVIGLMAAVNSLRKKVEASMAVDADEVLHYEAVYGNVSTRVSGSGSIEDVDAETVTVPEGVEIEEVTVQTNEKLRKGDVIATVDLTSVLSTMATVQSEIDSLDSDLAKAGNDAVSSTIAAGAAGRIKKVYVTKDADVASCMVENGALALISLDGKMAVDFENTDLEAGAEVRVERADGSLISGTVDRNVKGKTTVLVTDNGPELDETVRVLDADGKEFGSGALYIHSVFRVTGFTGTVSSVSAKENQQVYKNSTVCSLTDTAHSARYSSILKQRGEKEKTLLELLELYRGGALRAPFDGTVLSIEYDENKTGATAAPTDTQSGAGDPYASYFGMGSGYASAGSTAAAPSTDAEETDGTAVVKMAPDQSMKVKISVDETDILSLEKGQEAEITIDSVGNEKIRGVVTDVDRTASGGSGVTSYSAEITFDKGAGMLGGMTADVVINIQGTENVLIVPTDAVHKTSAGAFVYTSYDETTKLFGGVVPVEAGISNDDFTEIRSGLEEGTVVYYTEKETNDFFMMMGGGRPGGNRR